MRLAIGGILSTAVLGLSSAPVLAQGMGMDVEPGFYAGVGGGFTTVDFCDDLTSLGATSCDDSDVGFKIFGGVSLNQYFSAEFGYVDLGEVSFSGPGGSAAVEADGFQLAALGIYPIDQFSLHGKIGWFFWDASLTSNVGISADDDGSDLMFGAGGSWHVTPQISIRGEWERFDFDGDDVDMFSASVIYNF